MEKTDLLSLPLPRLTQWVTEELGEPGFRAKQIYQWLHQKQVTEFSAMTNLSAALRGKLEEKAVIAPVSTVTRLDSQLDETRKFLFSLADGNCVETVWMEYNHGPSLCISTQVGCRQGCRFCASTLGGLVRSLTAGEMLGEIYEAQRQMGKTISSLVLMGIGEPLDNFENVMDFLEKMCASCNKETENGAGDFNSAVREFVNSSALYGMKTEPDEKDREASPDKVNLMTLHASKGLEFDTVFIIGVNQGMIPLRCKDFEQEEEERRLFFVGITRAENNLELSWYTNPGEPGAVGEPSRYLRMIPEQLLNREGSGKTESERSGESEGRDRRKSDLHQLRKQVQEQIRLKRESVQKKEKEPKVIRVRHRKYGEGILISEDDMMIEAEFRGYGRKKFLKAFGEVEVLGAV